MKRTAKKLGRIIGRLESLQHTDSKSFDQSQQSEINSIKVRLMKILSNLEESL